MNSENRGMKSGKSYRLLAGTALLVGMATVGTVTHADGVVVNNKAVDSSQVSANSQPLEIDENSTDSGNTSNVHDDTTASVENDGKSNSGETPTPPAPVQPEEPSHPSTPNKPVTPGQPTTPDKPVTPSQPSTPNKPVTPSQPSTPNKPVTPSKPSTPNKPAAPSKPLTPNKPATPSKPTIPNKPAAPSQSTVHSAAVASGTTTNTSRSQSYEETQYESTAQVLSSAKDTEASISTGPVLNKIKAAQPIDKIDSSSTEAFIKSIAPRVQVLAGKNNLYASIILAQAILESGHGQSSMSQKYYNIFNITGSYLGKSISFETQEFNGSTPYMTTQTFRVYSNYDQSLDDYINLMIKGTTWNPDIYAGSWKSHAQTYQDAAQALQGVFATDPEYAQKLIEIIHQYNLNSYDNVDSTTQVWDDKTPASPVLSAKLDSSDFPSYNGVEYPGSDSYAFGNCTQYVYNRIIQLGGQIGTHMGNGGEWGINAQAQGYFTTSVPTEGYAVSFPPGVAGSSSEYGHVAFVEKVYSDNSILVSEMNVVGNNIVSERHISAGVAALATYIQPK